MKNKTNQLTPYTLPLIEVIAVEVEQGISVTNENVGNTNPDMGWDSE